MSSRESDESDENSQFKISVIMTPGETTENGWRDYSVDLDSGSCGYMDFELYTYVLNGKSKGFLLLIESTV
jgi:hypothetical protein